VSGRRVVSAGAPTDYELDRRLPCSLDGVDLDVSGALESLYGDFGDQRGAARAYDAQSGEAGSQEARRRGLGPK
jgi:hypothetical protein